MTDKHIESFVPEGKKHDALPERRIDALYPVQSRTARFVAREI